MIHFSLTIKQIMRKNIMIFLKKSTVSSRGGPRLASPPWVHDPGRDVEHDAGRAAGDDRELPGLGGHLRCKTY
jgi:hypothetical protein